MQQPLRASEDLRYSVKKPHNSVSVPHVHREEEWSLMWTCDSFYTLHVRSVSTLIPLLLLDFAHPLLYYTCSRGGVHSFSSESYLSILARLLQYLSSYWSRFLPSSLLHTLLSHGHYHYTYVTLLSVLYVFTYSFASIIMMSRRSVAAYSSHAIM